MRYLRRQLPGGLILFGVRCRPASNELARSAFCEDSSWRAANCCTISLTSSRLPTWQRQHRSSGSPIFRCGSTDRGAYGTARDHISRQNPQTQVIEVGLPAAPIWTFAAAHATGRLRPITNRKVLHDLLSRLIDKFEPASGHP